MHPAHAAGVACVEPITQEVPVIARRNLRDADAGQAEWNGALLQVSNDGGAVHRDALRQERVGLGQQESPTPLTHSGYWLDILEAGEAARGERLQG